MKVRNLDSIYIRAQVDGKWGSYCLTDLPWQTVLDWIEKQSLEAEDSANHQIEMTLEVAKHLHMSLQAIGAQLDLHRE